MKRRLALAATRMRRAPLLLMDEPFNSLDSDGSQLIDELLVETKARGGASIVVLHDIARSTLTFDRTIELKEGRIVNDVRPVIAPRPPLTIAR
jgi:ABC-type multidrug transport system ATPase subunit